MSLATRPHESIRTQTGGSSGSLPYGFHHEANDHRQSHAAAHGSDDDGRDFTCRGPARAFTNKLQKKTAE